MPKGNKKKKTPAEKTQERLERIEGLCLFDDIFMNQVFEENSDAAQCLINVLLNRTDLSIVDKSKVQVQRTISNLRGHGVRLDIYCEDSNGKLYDIEVQNPNEGAHPKRARYNSALIDGKTALIADNYENLPETYVIFIMRDDYFKKGAAVYHIDRVITEFNEPFKDDAHIVYVNGTYTGKDPIGRLMHDFHCTKAINMNYPVLAKQVQYLKETKEGREKMCKAMQDLVDEEVHDVLVDDKIQFIQNMMSMLNCTFETAFKVAGVDDNMAPEVLEAFGMKPA